MPRFSYVAGAAAVLIGTVLSLIPNCDYGSFETDSATGNCAFNCEYDDRYVEPSTLPFDLLREECDDVRFAAIFYPSECASAGDLVWPSGCTCPYCRCSLETTSVEYSTVTQFVYQECVSSVCQSVVIDEDTGESALARTYNHEFYVGDPETWTGFKCPPATCAVGDSSYTQFDTWVPTSSDGTCDDSFCYCGADGNEQCASFADVSSSSDAVLKSKFLNDCSSNIPDCLDDVSRVVNYPNDGYCSNSCYAKRCDCGDHSVDEEWYTEYVSVGDGDNVCVKCTCVNGNYVRCYSSSRGATQCPPQTSLNCHDERSSSLLPLQESVTYTVSELSSSDCSVAGNCGWAVYYNGAEENGTLDNFEFGLRWGCQDNLFCEAFVDVVDAPCVYYDDQVQYTDCNGVQRTEILKGYHSCCSDADNCNHGNIDTTQCVESTVYGTIVKEHEECIAAVNSAKFCEADNDVEITCEGIENHFVPEMQCFCTAYGTWYTRLTSTDTRAQLQQEMNRLGRQLTEWNDVFGCTIVASCDLTAGGDFTSGTGNTDGTGNTGGTGSTTTTTSTGGDDTTGDDGTGGDSTTTTDVNDQGDPTITNSAVAQIWFFSAVCSLLIVVFV